MAGRARDLDPPGEPDADLSADTRLGALEFLLESRDGAPSEAIAGTSRKREGAAVRGGAAGEPLAEVLEVGLPAGRAHRARERFDAMTYLGVGRVVALEAGEQLAGGRGVAPPEAHVGEGDPAVVVTRPLLEQPDEAAVRGGELTGPALQLWRPRTGPRSCRDPPRPPPDRRRAPRAGAAPVGAGRPGPSGDRPVLWAKPPAALRR